MAYDGRCHIPEKDGILANLLMLEAIAYSGKKLCELRKEIRLFKLDNILEYEVLNEKYTDKNTIKK